MSICFPSSLHLDTGMQSTASQAAIGESDAISDTLQGFQSQLQDLYSQTSSLIEQMRSRDENISQSSEMLERLESRVNEMVATTKSLETSIQTPDASEEDTARELHDLISERDHLESQISTSRQNATEADVEGQQRLLGLLQEESYRKMEDLCYMKERLATAQEDYQKEWNEYKAELSQHRNERRGYQEDIDHVKDITLARFIGMHAHAKTDTSERDLINRISEYRAAEVIHRQSQQNITDAKIRSKDLEDEIGDLITQKRDYWKRCLDLENCLDELNEAAGDRDVSLRPTSGHQDLTCLGDSDWSEQQEGRTDEYISQGLDFGHTGKILHRCHKQINLPIVDLISNENESEEVTTSVDTGALDTATDELVAKNSGADSETPQHDPEPEPEDQGGEQEQLQLPGKVVDKLSSGATTSSRVDTPRVTEAPEHHTPFITKLRKRVSGLSGSLRHHSSSKIEATGSTKRMGSPKRGGRR